MSDRPIASDILENLGSRLVAADREGLVKDALEHYRGRMSDTKRRDTADRLRKLAASEGRYLSALIHDQIYRSFGGED